MSFKFDKSDIEKISRVLDSQPEELQNAWTWNLRNPITNDSLVFTIYNNVKVSNDKNGTLISVQTHHGYFELHDSTGYIVFDPDEIIFVQATEKLVSSLIIGKQATCSMYANIDRNILITDFAELDPPVLLSAMQLSLAEGLLP